VRLHETWSGKWYPSTDIEFEEPASLPPGFVVLGDAHSHAEMYAYASHMDKEEEIYRDGLHIVVGRVNRPEVDLHVDFVMDRRRFHFAPEDVFADTRIQPFHQVPKAWLEKIHIQRHPYEYRQERYWQKSGEERRR
jgi:hypothetical protein